MILLGKIVAEEIEKKIKQDIERLGHPPGLAVLLIGNNPNSKTYVKMKHLACQKVGIHFFLHHLPDTITEQEVIAIVNQLNQTLDIHGILIQLPLPRHIDPIRILETVDPLKDVDGLHPTNLGKMISGRKQGFIPCTPLGIKYLLDYYKISIEKKHVVIIGRSTIVGKPLAALLMQNAPGYNATVTVVHSYTPNLIFFTQQADILIVAVGIPRFVKADMIKEGAIIIDVGINHEEGSLVGDVDFENVEKKCKAITPVPKGVGPMTVAMLLYNTLLAYLQASC
ncbi:MAG: bifunctional methylenetetrahydrofolate dehydrogenase/methenyltetrahydrofolate cyclohydrolase FolD [Chlamydiales bacterium]